MPYCTSCGSEFSYNKTFYDKMGFCPPKRCRKCIAERRGRTPSVDKECLLQRPNVRLDVPECRILEQYYISRHGSYTCLRIRISLGNQTVTIYDHRNKVPQRFVPLSGQLACASVRVMRAKGKEEYQYIVLDVAEGNGVAADLLTICEDSSERVSLWCLRGKDCALGIYKEKLL